MTICEICQKASGVIRVDVSVVERIQLCVPCTSAYRVGLYKVMRDSDVDYDTAAKETLDRLRAEENSDYI